MTQLMPKVIVFILLMCAVPLLVFANDRSSSPQSQAMFYTLKEVPQKTHSLPNPMTGKQLAAVEGMAGICAECVIGTHGRLAQEIIAAAQALVNQRMQSLSQRDELAQEIIVSTQALVNQMPQLQNRGSISQGQALAREIITTTQALVRQNLQNVQQGNRLAREIIVSTQALVNRSLSQIQVPNISSSAPRTQRNMLP